jgi:glutaredoxin
MALHSISGLDFAVVEMDDGQHEGWQARIAELAKSKTLPEAAKNNTMSVPQIFIEELYMGGSEDLADMYADKRLATMLGRASLSSGTTTDGGLRSKTIIFFLLAPKPKDCQEFKNGMPVSFHQKVFVCR